MNGSSACRCPSATSPGAFRLTTLSTTAGRSTVSFVGQHAAPYPHCSNEVVELAAIPIVWTFTSPNRRMRDYATKALTKLLSGHLPVLSSLIRRFDGVDDPYVIERLAVVVHGAVLWAAAARHRGSLSPVAEVLKQIALAGVQAPNIITRDAVRGVYEWCVRYKADRSSDVRRVTAALWLCSTRGASYDGRTDAAVWRQ